MDTSNQEKLLYPDKLQFPKKLRWFLTIGVFLIANIVVGQRNNNWMLETIQKWTDPADTSYCLNFNYCPPQNTKMYIEQDKYLRTTHTTFRYKKTLSDNFCDTNGQIVFNELIGQHYFNRNGIIYDTTYINNNYYQYLGTDRGLFLSNVDKTYYFKCFYKMPFELAGMNWSDAKVDSLFICVSEFDNTGNLLLKNKIIYRYSINNLFNWYDMKIVGFKRDEWSANIIFYQGSDKAIAFNYHFQSGLITNESEIKIDSLNKLKLSASNKLLLVSAKLTKEYTIYSINRGKFKEISKFNFLSLAPPSSGYLFKEATDFCFSPNDSLLYTTLIYSKDTVNGTKGDCYIFVIDIYKLSVVRFFKTRDGWGGIPGNNYVQAYLKLGPDGNIYYGSHGRINSKFRILHPNNLIKIKLERMSEIVTKKYPYQGNYSLNISTLEDYKKTEFIWQPTCDSLKVRFSNTCDTQYFRRYRLFFGNGDSINLDKNWNTKIYNYPNKGKYFVRLKAFSKIGGFIWYGDSIEINNPPIAKFGIQKTKGCQWIGYGFTDSSQLFSIKPGFKPYKHWLFGDGKDSIDASTNPKLTYTYTTSNSFTVKLVVNNGYCTDTASQVNNVVILPAPKPGILAAPINGCTPLKVDYKYKYSDVLDSAVWQNGLMGKAKGITGSFTYNQIGYFFLSQKLYGPSGCITSDSVLIKVHPGISGMPDILNATVTSETTIDLKWKKHLNAVSYRIVKNNSFLARTPDTTYTDKTANTLMANSYTVKAISMCNDSTTIQDLAQTIYLQAKRTDNNEAQLNWTAYQRWEFGVSTYQLFSQNEAGYFELLATINGQTLDYLDEGFAGLSQSQRCYKIITEEKNGNMQLSASNVYCLPLKPVLFIPSAFSPNGDGVNDTWKINYKGIKEAKIKIYNRWGEIVYLARGETEKPEWDAILKGLPVPAGTYFYQIEATGLTVGKVYKSGLVEVVR